MEFLTVATQYCGMLEQCQKQSREELLDSLLRILPVLYWNAQVLPAMETMGQFLPDDQVTEADYEYVRGNARALLDDWDEYEDLGEPERETGRCVSAAAQLRVGVSAEARTVHAGCPVGCARQF